MNSLRFILVAALAQSASAACPAEGEVMQIRGACSKENFAASGCDDANLDAIQAECDALEFDFEDITANHYQFDNNFMDGDGIWNQESESKSPMSVEAGRLTRFADGAAKTDIVQWPDYAAMEKYNDRYMSNFDLDDSCQLNTVMCCFTGSKKDELEDNADACNHDLQTSRKSNYMMRGYGTFDKDVSTYCTGYTWSEDENDGLKQYRGNGLYDISFGTFLEKGYVENIPGAPMCACIEQMPVVTNAACKTILPIHQLTRTNNVITLQSTTVGYEECGRTLGEEMKRLYPAKSAEIDARIVGEAQCPNANTHFLNENFLVPAAADHIDIVRWNKPDPNEWTQVAGLGLSYLPVKSFSPAERNPAFLELVKGGCGHTAHPQTEFGGYCIIRRYCESCKESHRDIYYVRLTPIPENIVLLDYFMSNWKKLGNLLNTDFELYSTYEDAIARTEDARWTYCNYDAGNVGFPRDCGFRFKTDCQWNSFTRGTCGGRDPPYSFGIYVEKK